MSFLESMKGGRRFGAVALAVIVGGALACKTSISDMNYQAGDYVFDFLADATLAGGDPAGAETISNLLLGAVDTTVTNAFGRDTGDGLFFFDPNAYDFAAIGRNSSTDGRLPALSDPDADVGGAGGIGCNFGSPPYGGAAAGAWDFWCEVENLEPSTRYTLMLVRYAVTVNGELDQNAIMAGEAITAPDELVVLGGAPAGSPNTECNFSTLIDVPPDANPFVLGYADSDANGEIVFDCLPTSGLVSPAQWWTDLTSGATYADSTPAGPNDGVTGIDLARNQYNYAVIVEGEGTLANPVPTGAMPMRFQIANDITAGNTGINNAQAPYPTEPVLAGPGVAVVAGELTMTWTNLAALSGAVYQVWVYNEETGDMKSPSGDWSAVDGAGDPMGDATGVQSFNTQGDWTNTFATSDDIGEYTHVFLSVESAPAGSPSAVQPVWAQYTDMVGEPSNPFVWVLNTTADMSFGTFASGSPVAWTSQGSGEGGFWGTECNPDEFDHCTGPTNTVEVVFRNLQVPPVGYYYNAYLIDENGEEADAGPLMSPQTYDDRSSVSLEDIDTDDSLQAEYTNGEDIIIWSQTLTTLSALPEGMGFYDYVEYRLNLVPKAGSSMGPTTALGGETPLPMRERKPESETEE
jgi:hypothetical protein